jgi:tRNA pseudouridine38-40 synthase
MRVALKFAYDGSKFYGYARQPNLRTVEGELIKTIIENDFIKDEKDSFFRSASRTDKSVSAFGNVISFNTKASKTDILNCLVDKFEDIVIYGTKDVKIDFNPRYAKYRIYRYHLNIKGLDFDKIISCSSAFSGEHNFSNFARVESFKDPVRVIDNIVFSKTGNYLFIDFYAQTFLWNQIRRIVSALIKIGKGKIQKENILEALYNPEKLVDFGVAPGEPLILEDIIYDFDFRLNKDSMIGFEDLKKKILNRIIF